MIENSLEKLTGECKIKAKVLMEVVRQKYPGLMPFETFRTRARQARLYTQLKKKGPVAKPGTSYHEKGLAVDRVFKNSKGVITRVGDYKYLQYIAVMCGLTGVKGETCHVQCNKKSIATCMKTNSARYNASKSASEQRLLSLVNTTFRKYGFK